MSHILGVYGLQITYLVIYNLLLVTFISEIHKNCKKKKHTQKSFSLLHLTKNLFSVYAFVVLFSKSVI